MKSFVILTSFLSWIIFQLLLGFSIMPNQKISNIDISEYILFLLIPSVPILFNLLIFIKFSNFYVGIMTLASILLYMIIFSKFSDGFQKISDGLDLVGFLILASLYLPILFFEWLIVAFFNRKC